MGSHMQNYRLPGELRADLEWYWCRADADLGVHSNMSATIARANLLAHGKHDVSGLDDRPSGIRLALATSGIDRISAARARRDEALRLFCVLGKPKHDQPFYSDLMPEHAERWRRKLRLIHSVLARLVKSQGGLRHEQVLFMVYGDPKQARLEDEIARLCKLAATQVIFDTPGGGLSEKEIARVAEMPDTRRVAKEMLSVASRSYLDAHVAEIAQRKAEREEQFRARMGAA